jgi:hypothetical protein
MSVLRFFALQIAIGFGIAALFVVALLLADPGGIGALLRAPTAGPLPAMLLWLFTGLTFGSVQFATALALVAEEGRDGDRGSLSAAPWARARPAFVPAPARVLRRPRSPSP